ncbi:MAG: hypothetical protein JST75_13990 [Bacteroidetes bacterium]|nr:hypothetical protein [Bacteroidota bacterium]
MKKFLRITGVIILIALLIFVYFHYFWVFGEGVKAGQLNYVVKKGYIFKTYEGSLIQTGFKGSTAGTIQSYEFRFSIADEAIAQKLMTNSGKEFELHYKEYIGALPWRGATVFVVDSIYAMRDSKIGPGSY